MKDNCWQRTELVKNTLNCLSLNIIGLQNNIDTFPPKYSHEEKIENFKPPEHQAKFHQPLVTENALQPLFSGCKVESVCGAQKKQQGYFLNCY